MDVKYSMEASSRPSRPGAFLRFCGVALRHTHCMMLDGSALPREHATEKTRYPEKENTFFSGPAWIFG